MDSRGDLGEPVAIIGMACRFPGARDPAEFHDLAVTGRPVFSPATALPGRPLRAAMLDDWTVPQIVAGDSRPGDVDPEPPDLGPVQKLATEITALALTDAGLRDAAGTSRTGLFIASTAPGLGDLVREQFRFPACGPHPHAAEASSLHAVTAAVAAFFFFQAEDGIRDLYVTGVQTCALPISLHRAARAREVPPRHAPGAA